jgi:uncharacterized protein (DUF58 family)
VVVTGRAVLTAAGLGVAVLVHPVWATLWLGTALLVLLLVVDAYRAPHPRDVALSRAGDTQVRLGETAEVLLRISNQAGRPLRGWVRDAWPPSAGAAPRSSRVDIPAGERRTLATTLRPIRRGARTPDRVTVRSLGPWGLAGRQKGVSAPWRVDALPAFLARKHLPSKLARLRDLEGRTIVLQRGQGTEFDSLREYVVGDDVRSIDWRATARSADVMVRTWRPERDRHVMIVLDCGRTSAARVGDAPRLDAAIEATLLLSALASRAGDRVDVLAWDRRVRGSVQGQTGADLLSAVTHLTAHVDPTLVETDWAGLVPEITRRSRHRSLVVLLSSLDPAPLSHGLMPVVPMLVRRHQVVLAAVGDPALAAMVADRSDLHETYRAAAAAGFTRERRAASERLQRLGVDVVDALPDDLAPAVADHYLALKAAGRL